MREIRLVHHKPEHNARILQNAQDPRVGATDKSVYRLTSSDDSFFWNPALTEHMMHFLRFLKDNSKSLVVRLHGFSQDDENMQRWFHQACQWDLIVGLVSNSLESQAFFICHAISNQNASVALSLKMHLYPADFYCVDAHHSLAQAFQRSKCLNRLEIKVLIVGFQLAFENTSRILSRGVVNNASIRNLWLSGWGHTALNLFFADLVDRDASLDQLILENAGKATVGHQRNSIAWCQALNRVEHIGFLSCKDLITTSHCLYDLDSAVLCHLQLTKGGWVSSQIDGLLVKFSQDCPNLSTLDVSWNKIEDLRFPRFSAAVLDFNAESPTSPGRRPLRALTSFLLDANPILSDEMRMREKVRPNLYCLFQKIPSLVTIMDSEAKNKKRTNNKEQAELDKIVRCMRILAIDSPHLGMRLPSAAWPQLFGTANRMLQGEPSLQAQVIFDVLVCVNASAFLSHQATEDPIDAATTSNKSADKGPSWVVVQKLLSWS